MPLHHSCVNFGWIKAKGFAPANRAKLPPVAVEKQ